MQAGKELVACIMDRPQGICHREDLFFLGIKKEPEMKKGINGSSYCKWIKDLHLLPRCCVVPS